MSVPIDLGIDYMNLREAEIEQELHLSPSIGLVVDVLYSDPEGWEREINEILSACDVGHLELWMEHIPDANERASLLRALDGISVTVHAPFVDMSLASRWTEHADACMYRLGEAIDASLDLGSAVFTIHAGKFADFEEHNEVLKRVAERYDWLSSRCAGQMEVGIENLKAKRSGVSRESVALLSDLQTICEMNPDLRLTPDVGHAVQNGDDPAALLYFSNERIASVHMHDAVLGERSHRAFGNGELQLDVVAEAIVDLNPKYLTLELLSLEDGVQSIRSLNAHLQAAHERRAAYPRRTQLNNKSEFPR